MQKIGRSLTAEFLGTFLFAFIAVGVVVVDASRGGQLGLPGIAIAQGLAFAIAVTATLSISGGHINPAVTFGLWLAKRIGGKLGALYVLAQLLAAVLAVVCVNNEFVTETFDVVVKEGIFHDAAGLPQPAHDLPPDAIFLARGNHGIRRAADVRQVIGAAKHNARMHREDGKAKTE